MKWFELKFNMQDYVFDLLMVIFMYGLIQTDMFRFLLEYSIDTAIFVFFLVVVAMAYHVTLFWYNALQLLLVRKRDKFTVLHGLFFILTLFWYMSIWSVAREYIIDNYAPVVVITLVLVYAGGIIAIVANTEWKEAILIVYGVGFGLPLFLFLYIFSPIWIGSALHQISGMKWLGWVSGILSFFLIIYVSFALFWLGYQALKKLGIVTEKKKNDESVQTVDSESKSARSLRALRTMKAVATNFFIIVIVFYFELVYDMAKTDDKLLYLIFTGVLPARIAHLLGKPVQIGNLISLVVFLVLLITNL